MSRALRIAALVSLLAPSVLQAQADPRLVGTWECGEGDDKIVLELGADGKGTMDEDPITWRAQGETLEIGIEGEFLAYAIKMEGDKLRVSGGDLDQPMTFQRKGGKKKGLGGRRTGLAGKLGGGEPRPPVDTPKPAEAGIIGAWETTGPAGVITLELKDDRTGSIGGQPFKFMYTEKTLALAAGTESVEYRYELKGDVLVLSGGDLPQPTEFRRKGVASKPGPTPGPSLAPSKGLVGTWTSATETFEIRADGTILVNGNSVNYEVQGSTLTLVGPGGRVPYEFSLEGDILKLTSDGTTDTYHRVGGAGGTAPGYDEPGNVPIGVAGVWVCQEASLDPSNSMSYTQYIGLLPDGSVAYEKAEGGASRQAISEYLERFRSWRNDGTMVGDAGRWESDGRTIRIEWRLWNGLVSEGEVDLTNGRMTLSKMGVLDEGATLTFERQR